MDLVTDTIVDGRYRIVDLVGFGGMGGVYKAVDVELERVIALKILHSDFPDEEARSRFFREGKIASRLEHPNIVQFFRFGQFEGLPYIAMEYLSGETLREVLNRETRLDLQRSIDVAVQVCRAMQYAHRNGVVHRDLKPNNIMLMPAPVPDFVKVVDFGLARLTEVETTAVKTWKNAHELQSDPGSSIGYANQGLTQTGTILGTAQYMSPEQCKGQPVTAAADVYSLGCILYECIAGIAPFVADTPVAFIHKHVCEEIPPLDTVAPGLAVPPSVEQVLRKAMAKDPEDRYATMSDFEADLLLVQAGKLPVIPTKAQTKNASSKRWIALVGVFVLSGILLGVVYRLKTPTQSESQFPATSVSKLHTALPLGLEHRDCASLLEDGERYWQRNTKANKGEAFYKAAIVAARDPAINPGLRLRCYYSYAFALRTSGRYEESMAIMNEAIRCLKDTPKAPPTVSFQVYSRAAMSCLESSAKTDFRRGLQCLQQAEKYCNQIDDLSLRRVFQSELCCIRSDFYHQDSDDNNAFLFAQKGLSLTTRRQDLNRRRIRTCRLAFLANQTQAFEQLFKEVQAQDSEVGTGREFILLSDDLRKAGKLAESRIAAELALKASRAIDPNSDDAYVRAQLILAEFDCDKGDFEMAASRVNEAERIVDALGISSAEVTAKQELLKRKLKK